MDERILKSKMALKSMNYQDLAEVLGVSRTTIYRWVRKPGAIPLDMIKAIKVALKLTTEDVTAIFLL